MKKHERIILGIDASNIKAGGGITHLKNLLAYGNPIDFNISKVVVWGGESLKHIPNKSWLEKRIIKDFDKSFFHSSYSKIFVLGREVDSICDVLFCPGGVRPICSTPVVSMSQNMLVFESPERARFPLSKTRVRYHVLEVLQYLSFRFSKANIFISNYAQNYIVNKYSSLGLLPAKVIYHGIGDEFRGSIRKSKPMSKYSFEAPFKLLYVSIINYYKHQDKIIPAVIQLRREGFPIELNLVGPCHIPMYKKIKGIIEDKEISQFIKYHGKVDYEDINTFYNNSDGFIFASTCENMPNILIEAMSAGLPILCSNYGPMPEILKSAGIYFDPLCKDSTKKQLEKFLLDYENRDSIAVQSKILSESFTWKKCADQTFSFLSNVNS